MSSRSDRDARTIRRFGVVGIRGFPKRLPTLNLAAEQEIVPANGVYATETFVDGRGYRSATNVGVRPTFGGTALSVETHLLAFTGTLLGAAMTLAFVERIRPERAFPGPEALARQIREDVARVRELLAAAGPGIIR